MRTLFLAPQRTDVKSEFLVKNKVDEQIQSGIKTSRPYSWLRYAILDLITTSSTLSLYSIWSLLQKATEEIKTLKIDKQLGIDTRTVDNDDTMRHVRIWRIRRSSYLDQLL